MSKNISTAVVLLVLSQGVLSQQLPSAGSQMQQIPATPNPEKAVPRVDFSPASPSTAEPVDGLKITVKSLRITNAQVYSEADLLAVTGFVPGSELSLSELRGMAARITRHYHQDGYILAQAYLPAQDVQDGMVTIAVLDGRYGKVTLNNQSRVSDALANQLLDGLHSGDTVSAAPLENRLLLLSDLPGVNVNSTLAPGSAPGESDLVVDLTPGRRVSGSVDADNAGNRYTGEYRLGVTVNVNELAGQGDVASLRLLTSGSGLNYARAAYQMQFGKAKAGVAYSQLNYALGREFESLHAHGTAKVASIFGSYPLIRSRNDSLYAGLNFDSKKFHDLVDSTLSVSDKAAQVLTASLYGDHRDNFGYGGLNIYSLAWSVGNLDIQTPAVRSLDSVTAQSNGHFNKLAFSAARLQNLSESLSFYAAINGQVGSKNLDVSEKMELGGMYGVRAYPEGEAFGDEGLLLTLEIRKRLPNFSERQTGQLQLIGFVDAGAITVNKRPWKAANNHRNLAAVGVGLNWTVRNDFVVRTYYARKLGSDPATSAPDRSGRFWIQAIKYF